MKPIKNNKGVALVTVVLIFLVLVILLAGVMFASVTNQKNAVLSKDHTSAYYVAESGLNLAIEKLRYFLTIENDYSEIPAGDYIDYIDDLEDFLENEINNLSGSLDSLNKTNNYSISVQQDLINLDHFTITSIGTVDGVERILTTDFVIDKIEKELMKAVITKNSINSVDGGGGNIIGEVASLMEDSNSFLKLRGCDIGTVYIPEGETASVNTNCTDISIIQEPKPVFDETAVQSALNQFNDISSDLIPVTVNNSSITFPGLTGTKKGYTISKLPNTGISFNLGSGSDDRIVKLYVTDVDYADNKLGNLSVSGNGKLAVIITVDSDDTKKVSGVNGIYQWGWDVNKAINPLDLTKFQLVIKKGSGFSSNESPTFTTPNDLLFIGSVLANDVNIRLNNMEFKGFIATMGKSISFNSNSEITGPMWIFAPNAIVEVKSGATINGAVMANTVNLTSNSTIKYDVFDGSLPFNITIPTFYGGALYPVGIEFKFTNFKEV